jgi:hypothetical protein
MSIKFATIEKGNPADPSAPKKHHAIAKASGTLTLRGLGKEIAEGSTTVSDTDVIAVLNDLGKILCRHLANGEMSVLATSARSRSASVARARRRRKNFARR